MLASSCSDPLHPFSPSLPRVVGGGERPASRDRPPIALATVNRIKIYRHRRCASQRKQFAFSPSYVFEQRGEGGWQADPLSTLPSHLLMEHDETGVIRSAR
ncbi:hypothetical protein AVEN_119377-1 [Araneus ventricosus]|uniref:Uncharacterized protein n=1 Tax=Araneus ventricosus TaxID=182803 RepID=A0A4Y2SS40_ARAVE|nr:hypothetical protein AVEN_89346-1 [Araneus ventricosus]GBN91145.1 hypothetical protein AVEN_225121-1 [Araneus ventricosus]GBN91188.1 hypothetical protein AVEN_221641-1 [Araneus ventricosus]GBN91467.1 hypothetical protein AVEN_119377-1 [Araneus ventricosus]